jgi:hypothetical protein
MSLMDDVKGAFEKKGLEFVSLSESTGNPDKSVLTYKDASGISLSKEVAIRLSDLEDTIVAVDIVDPMDLANYLLNESPPVAQVSG